MSAGGGDGDGRLRVVLTVGTDHHPFDRVVEWTDRWCAAQAGGVDLTAQTGTSTASRTGPSQELIDPTVLQGAMGAAHAVVCHGGPGTIMDARRAGVDPIVVPRSAARGEHVDDHQERFARWLSDRDEAIVAGTEAELHGLLDRLRRDPDAYRRAGSSEGTVPVARRFGELVEALLG